MPPVPTGIITLWSGAIVDIPAGWALCDGNNGTPDLRDQFVVGAGTTYNPGDSAGAVQHQHTGTTDGHQHTIGAGLSVGAGANFAAGTDLQTDTFTTANSNHLPPYYALAYIMRL